MKTVNPKNTDHTVNMRPLPRNPLFTLVGTSVDASNEVQVTVMGLYMTRQEAFDALDNLPARTDKHSEWNIQPVFSHDEVLTGATKTLNGVSSNDPTARAFFAKVAQEKERQQDIEDYIAAGGTKSEAEERYPDPSVAPYLPGGIFDGTGSTLPTALPPALTALLDAEPTAEQGQALFNISFNSMIPHGTTLGALVEEASFAIAAGYSSQGVAIKNALRDAELDSLPDIKRYAILALAAREHMLPTDAFTAPSGPGNVRGPVLSYEWLLAPWVSVMGQVHPDDSVRYDWIN